MGKLFFFFFFFFFGGGGASMLNENKDDLSLKASLILSSERNSTQFTGYASTSYRCKI